MPTLYTTQLGLSLPTQGELSGTWGDVTNNSMTSLVDTAIAGTTLFTGDTDVTLTATVGIANQARAAILLCTGARTALRTLTAPASSKIYYVINATTGGFAVKLCATGPTTGVTIAAGKQLVVVWNGSDFVPVGGDASTLSGVLAIANGGTGSTSAAAALTALGAAPTVSPTLTGTPLAPTPGSNVNTTQIVTGAWVNSYFAPLANAALTGVPTAPTAAPGTATNQIATMNALIAAAFAAALPNQTGNAGKFVTTDGATASWAFASLVVTPVSGTSHSATVGTNVILNNVADTAVTAPTTFVAGNLLTISPNNGRPGNTLDVGAKTVKGYRGVPATGVIPLSAVRPIELVAIDANTWMML